MASPRKKKLEETYWSIMREMYKRASPSADIDELVATGEAQEDYFYNRYYLSTEDCREIFDKGIEGKRLKEWELSSLSFHVFLGGSPCSNKETVIKTRKELGLEPIE